MPELIDMPERVIDKVVLVIKAAGGELVGRTRLQKTIYLLEIAGLLDDFNFEYRHYGPYSEDLSHAVTLARLLGRVTEEERRANWGGAYSVYRTGDLTAADVPAPMRSLIDLSAKANPVALELAATAAFLAKEGYSDPWQETIDRKSDKAQFIEQAKQLYEKLSRVETPSKLPSMTV